MPLDTPFPREARFRSSKTGQQEPRLEEALTDPVVQAVMAAYGVAPEDVSHLMARLRHHLAVHGLADAVHVRSSLGPANSAP